MNPTHQDIIKQQVEKLYEIFPDIADRSLAFFVEGAMHAAAHAAEKAGEVNKQVENSANDTPTTAYNEQTYFNDGWNSSRGKSRRQLDEHFGRLKLD